MYDPQQVSVIYTDDSGKQQVVSGLDTDWFSQPSGVYEKEEFIVASELMHELNKALIEFPFKIRHTPSSAVAVEEILREAYVNKLGSYKTLPLVHFNQKTRLFWFTMVNVKDEMKER